MVEFDNINRLEKCYNVDHRWVRFLGSIALSDLKLSIDSVRRSKRIDYILLLWYNKVYTHSSNSFRLVVYCICTYNSVATCFIIINWPVASPSGEITGCRLNKSESDNQRGLSFRAKSWSRILGWCIPNWNRCSPGMSRVKKNFRRTTVIGSSCGQLFVASN